ncbi:MAG: hypothetical protein AB7O67_02925 [Vicinamibacterales bacterium]
MSFVRTGWIQCVALMAVSACAPAPPALDAIAEGYVRVALALAQHQPSLVDAFQGPDGWRPGARVPVAALGARVAGLRESLAHAEPDSPADRHRAAYLDGQLAALDLVVQRLLGTRTTFADEVRQAFGVPLTGAPAGRLDAARATLTALLPGDDRQPLRARYLAYRDAAALPPAAVERRFADALDRCRATTLGHLTLPPGEHVTLEWGDTGPWEAYARDAGGLGTVIDVTRSGEPTAAHAAHVACHEGYPGHHVQHVLMTRALVEARGWLEFTLAPAFGPHLLISEGAAEAGARLALSEARPDGVSADDLAIEEAVADLSAAVPPLVAAYLDGTLDGPEAARRLEDEALVADGPAFLAFAERARVRAVAYPLGTRLVEAALDQAGEGKRWERLAEIFESGDFVIW